MLKVKNEWVSNIPVPIKYARLSHKSLDKSDSTEDKLGENDFTLAKNLCKSGSSHRKFMRQIHVLALVEAPWKWWKEYATYKVGTTENSSSMMHTLIDGYFDENDFCFERMTPARQNMIDNANEVLDKYNDAPKDRNYHIWEELNDIIGGGYKYKRIIDLPYEQVANMYFQRKVHPHKMREWHYFADWIETLPYFELIEISARGDKEK
jgi:hypothetical protein